MEQAIITLLEKAQAGDEEAFNEIYQKYYQSAFIKANQICQNEADAKDAVQDAFIQIHASLRNLRDVSSFYSWMIMIVINKCKNQFHKNRLLNHTIRDGEAFQFFKEERIYMNPHSFIENESEKEVMKKMIQSLPESSAEFIDLMYFKQMKLSEIATYLNIPLGTVKSRSLKARKELKHCIERYEAKEGYHLSFKLDTILPTLTFGALLGSLFTGFKSTFTSFSIYASQHAVVLVAAAALGVVGVGGVISYSQAQDESMDFLPTQALSKSNTDIAAFENPYTAMYYQEREVENNKEAYFTCLKFAQNETEMKQRSVAEREEILPIYEELKQHNSVYYQTLKAIGWETWFALDMNI